MIYRRVSRNIFAEVQKLTSCSTGCGGCHDKIMAVLSERLSG